MSTYILVHGAWHGAWCWHKTAPLLEGAGHRVVAPDLPGHGVDTTPPPGITLADQVGAVGDLLDRQTEDVILVGHSSGGAIITQVAEDHPEAVSRLVYLSAFLPPDGSSVTDLAQQDPDSAVLRHLVVDEQAGLATIDGPAVADALYHDCSPADVHLARSLLRPEPLATITTPVSTTPDRFGSVPRTYLACTHDRAITPRAQEAMQATLPCEHVLTLDTSHSPFLTNPVALADHLVAAQS